MTEPVRAPESELDPLARAHLTRGRMLAILCGLGALTAVSALVATAFGSVHISLARALADPASPDHAIFFACGCRAC